MVCRVNHDTDNAQCRLLILQRVDLVNGERQKGLDDRGSSIEPEEIEKVKRSGKQDWQDAGNMKDADILQ